MIGIYRITNPKGKVYIGKSVDIKNRKWKYMSANCKNQVKIHRSLLKYGWVNHKFEVLEECSLAVLSEREIYYIKLYDSVKTGLNLTYGGGINSLTKEHKEKIKKALIGKKHTKERTKKATETRLKNGYKASKETRKKLSELIRFNYKLLNSNKKLVINLENGVFYDSVKEAAYCYGQVYNTFKGRLNGSKPNHTNITYA